MKATALISTTKGLIVYNYADSQIPELQDIHFTGFAVNMTYVDESKGRWWAGISHKHWGQKLHFTDNRGKTWHAVEMPSYQGALLPNGSTAKMKQIWCMASNTNQKEGVLWMGTEPGGLFKSEDGGNSFHLVGSLWNHPSREDQTAWFGAGSDHPFIHSISVNPNNANHLYVSVSCAGVFESQDGGDSWNPRNEGLVAAYLPNPKAEYGHDPHRVMIHPKNPDVLWQQNHCGVFVSRNGGKSWNNVSRNDSIPYYGFALAIDEAEESRAWVIPVQSDEMRVAPNLKLQVWRTDDFGNTWNSDSEGLPESEVFDIVLRHAFDRCGDNMMFGTTNGNVFYKSARDSWQLLNEHLTKINSVQMTRTE